jgi:hypothetical protein
MSPTAVNPILTPTNINSGGPNNTIGLGNQMFGTPGATTSGAAGKMGIAQGPQLGMGTVAGSNLAANQANLAPTVGAAKGSSPIGGGK